MKLTNKDKNYLSSIGYHNDDFDVIERNSKSIKYELMSRTNKDISVKLNQKQAISLLGRETFLSGIGRATFHDSAVRTTESNPNLSVYFY
jgi:hypothetical protein